MESTYIGKRALVARLTKKHVALDDPVMVAAKLAMNEAFLLLKLDGLLDKLTEVRPELRAEINALLTARRAEAAA